MLGRNMKRLTAVAASLLILPHSHLNDSGIRHSAVLLTASLLQAPTGAVPGRRHGRAGLIPSAKRSADVFTVFASSNTQCRYSQTAPDGRHRLKGRSQGRRCFTTCPGSGMLRLLVALVIFVAAAGQAEQGAQLAVTERGELAAGGVGMTCCRTPQRRAAALGSPRGSQPAAARRRSSRNGRPTRLAPLQTSCWASKPA